MHAASLNVIAVILNRYRSTVSRYPTPPSTHIGRSRARIPVEEVGTR
jgi:hypothetical protein